MFRIQRSVSPIGTTLLLFSILSSTAWSVGEPIPGIRTVALTGMTPPGAFPTVTFTDFADYYAPPLVNRSGETSFFATLSSGDTGVYFEGGGRLSQIAKQEVRPPGTTNGVYYSTFGSLNLNNNGAVAYNAALHGPNVNRYEIDDTGIWSNRGGTNSLIARAGRHAIGYPANVDYGFVNNVVLNNSDRLAYIAYPSIDHTTTTAIGALYTDVTGNFQLVARTGDPAPGIAGTTYDIIGHEEFWLNDAGDITYLTSLAGAQTGSALWSKKLGQTPAPVFRTGTPAPGLSGLQFSAFACCIEVADARNMVFGGLLSGDGVNDGNNETLYFSDTDETTLIVREGQQAFDLPAGVQFGRTGNYASDINTFRAAEVNAKGDILFRAGLKGTGVDVTNNSGIWFGNIDDGFHLIAREGDATPGMADLFGMAQNMELNTLGQFAFLTTSGYSPRSDPMLWAVDLDGQLKLIARQGQQIDVDNGPGVDLWTIDTLDIFPDFGNGDNESFSLSDLGHIAFRAEFTDGSVGVFVSSLIAVPEPASIAELIGATLAMGFRRRRVAVA